MNNLFNKNKVTLNLFVSEKYIYKKINRKFSYLNQKKKNYTKIKYKFFKFLKKNKKNYKRFKILKTKKNSYNKTKWKRKFTKKDRRWHSFKKFWIWVFFFNGPGDPKINIVRSQQDFKRRIFLKKFLLKDCKNFSISNFNFIKKKIKYKLIHLLTLLVFKLESLGIRLHFAWDLLKMRYLISNKFILVNTFRITNSNLIVKVNDKLKLKFKGFFLFNSYWRVTKVHAKRLVRNLNWIEYSGYRLSGIVLRKPYLREILNYFLFFNRTYFWLNSKVLSNITNNFY